MAAVPFLFTPLPPLIDLPGHIGQFAIQTAAPSSPLRNFYEFHWAFVLNLGVDALVELLRQPLGLVLTVRLIAASIPALTVFGVLLTARTVNRSGAAAAPWAMLFAWSEPLNYGFLNYTLAAALSLISYAAWTTLERRPFLRASVFLLIQPAMIVAHAVGGMLLPMMIGSYELCRRNLVHRRWPGGAAVVRFVGATWPLSASAMTVAVWWDTRHGSGGTTSYSFLAKIRAVTHALRDQSQFLDVASVAAAFAIFCFGYAKGAKLHGGREGPVLAVLLTFLIVPTRLSGSSLIDMRLVPMIAMLALAQQDWSAVCVRARSLTSLLGLALFAIRLSVTSTAFIGYAKSYRMELNALKYIPVGARVLNLTGRLCGSAGWRSPRLDHLSSMAVLERQAWVNTQWDVGDIQSLTIRYRPSPVFYHDPYHYVWPQRCIGVRKSIYPDEQRHTIAQSMPHLPIDRADFLWLIATSLPSRYKNSQLVRVWQSDRSSLYRINRLAVCGTVTKAAMGRRALC
ncbi:MAG: hypothetical protein JOY99_07335 [Sphingomonadaceae bacterium]|nr:hypothetical protein [Sphingomonadaceae bacterium]